MTRTASLASPFVSPLSADWTIVELLEWIGASDDRCHDERLLGILDAVNRTLDPDSPLVAGRVVARVRALALRVSREPAVGERTLGEVAAAGAALGAVAAGAALGEAAAGAARGEVAAGEAGGVPARLPVGVEGLVPV